MLKTLIIIFNAIDAKGANAHTNIIILIGL